MNNKRPLIGELTDSELLGIANTMMDDLMNASTRKDYQAHIQHFTQRAQSVLDETQFKVVCEIYQEKMGVFTEREFVALFRRPDSVAIIWRQRYSKVAGDYVAEMVMKIENTHFRVDHAFVF